MSVQRLLVLGGSATQLPLVHAALARSWHVAVADANERCAAFEVAGVTAVHADFSSVEAVIDALGAIRFTPTGVTSMSADRAVIPQAQLASHFGCAGLAPDVAVRCRHKDRMMATLVEAGVRVPLAVHGVPRSFPVVVKPVDGSGQRGVSLVRRESELARALEQAASASAVGEVRIEEFVAGPEYTVDGFVFADGWRSILVTRREHVAHEGRFFGVCRAHLFPSGLGPARERALVSLVARSVEALGIDWGATHAELRTDGEDPVLIELGARMSGGQLSELGVLVTGHDQVGYLLDAAVGAVPDYRVPDGVPAAAGEVRFVLAGERFSDSEEVVSAGRYESSRAMHPSAQRLGYEIVLRPRSTAS